MEQIALLFLIGIPTGYVHEGYYYELQKIGKWSGRSKFSVVCFNLSMLSGLIILKMMADDIGIDNFNQVEKIFFVFVTYWCSAVAAADGALIGGSVRKEMRFLKNEQVPLHLMRTEEDEEREAKIREAHKEKHYQKKEQEAGFYEPEEEPVPDPEPEIDHEAELEEILKSRK